jgi:hypothetical protein
MSGMCAACMSVSRQVILSTALPLQPHHYQRPHSPAPNLIIKALGRIEKAVRGEKVDGLSSPECVLRECVSDTTDV